MYWKNCEDFIDILKMMTLEKCQVMYFRLAFRIHTVGLFIKNTVLNCITAGINVHLTNETYVVALDDLIVHICSLLRSPNHNNTLGDCI